MMPHHATVTHGRHREVPAGWTSPRDPIVDSSTQLDRSKTKAEVAQDLVWNINQQTGDIAMKKSLAARL
jgi:hypothetical protein